VVVVRDDDDDDDDRPYLWTWVRKRKEEDTTELTVMRNLQSMATLRKRAVKPGWMTLNLLDNNNNCTSIVVVVVVVVGGRGTGLMEGGRSHWYLLDPPLTCKAIRKWCQL